MAISSIHNGFRQNWRKITPILLVLIGGMATGCQSDHTIVVAADGSGNFATVQGAIDSLSPGGKDRVSIHVKPGTYVEHITISSDKPPIRIYGDDAESTIFSFDLQHNRLGSNGIPIGTANSASTTVRSNDFEADDITFVNSTAPNQSQAVALAAEGDRQIYKHCRMIGWTDTLFTNGGAPPMTPGDTRPSGPSTHHKPATTVAPTASWINRLYFKKCYIEGDADFIFGSSTAVFQDCNIHAKRAGYLTAASTLESAEYGYVFIDCKLTADDGVKDGSVYLGRPWRDYSNVIYMNCWMGPHIQKAGWSTWSSVPKRIHTARYSEYQSTGPGAHPDSRVAWSHQLTDDQAKGITIQSVIGGDDHWDPTK